LVILLFVLFVLALFAPQIKTVKYDQVKECFPDALSPIIS